MWINETPANRLIKSDTPELLTKWDESLTELGNACCDLVDARIDDYVHLNLLCSLNDKSIEAYIMVKINNDQWVKLDQLSDNILNALNNFYKATKEKCSDRNTWWDAFNLEIKKNRTGIISMHPLEN